MNLADLKGSDRELVITALQALYRERQNAHIAVQTVCLTTGKKVPSEEFFGLNEVFSALREIGASPIR